MLVRLKQPAHRRPEEVSAPRTGVGTSTDTQASLHSQRRAPPLALTSTSNPRLQDSGATALRSARRPRFDNYRTASLSFLCRAPLINLYSSLTKEYGDRRIV